MPLWGIVLLGLAAWVLVSVVLGVIIGRAVRIADAHRRDDEFVRRLSRRPASAVRTPHDDAWLRPAGSEASSAATIAAPVDGRAAVHSTPGLAAATGAPGFAAR